MAGERTADMSPARNAGSTDDDISTREHLQRQIDTTSAWEERLNTEQDRRYEQRFNAQEQAVQLALARVDKEFHEHIQQVRTETHAALEAADKAITKSETATEKRFELVNEFRAQLNDQARTFITRDESLSRHDRTTEQMAEMTKRQETEMRTMRERIDRDIALINSRLDLGQGRSTGLDKAWAYLVAVAGVAIAVAAILLSNGGS